ncbi:HAD-IA family hydrolase [Ornithinimicrobium ciconiae]|uniref:Tyrosine-protein kinase PtkA n=1 Tax=Ornithinimicrobium ciconiae TaxID=2594265 RepID=A0A516GEU0_9MICO|nr:HAD-IA family hydrolase [Ornithinimicrobium ciconiae]QDO90044.1 HAD-IA family hydrolase [Ornithinimicrobium ciconiae]
MTGAPGNGADPTAPPVVLFDFDGTLADTIPLIVASFRHTVAEVVGHEVTDVEARSWIGHTLIDTFGQRYPARADELVTAYRAWNLAHHDELIRPVDGIPEVLDGLLAAGSRIGVVSSKSVHTVRRGLDAVGLAHDFEVLVGLESTTVHKPHAEPLLHAAHTLAVEPSDCVYVGDAVVDIRAAQAAGMRGIAVTWGAGTVAELRDAGAVDVVDTAGELLGILLRSA